jgi:serine/threonine protein kinase
MDPHKIDTQHAETLHTPPADDPFQSLSELEGSGGLAPTRSGAAGSSVSPGGRMLPVRVQDTPFGRLGEYEIEKLLGQGGMGQVFLARDPRLNRPVAVKTLLPEFAAARAMAERFVREARSAGALTHPNVVQVYMAGVDGTTPYFAMEFVEGKSLKDVIAEEGAVPAARALDYAIQAAKGLRAAAEKKIIHRDIKPGNLMLDRSGVVKIADFGLAKNVESDLALTQTGALIGSPYYMSPEQGAGQPATFQSDIYSLGATLWHMLAGKPPFEASTPVSVLMKHTAEPLPRPEKIAAIGNGQVHRVLTKMMAKKPQDRHASYDELIDELERLYLETKLASGSGRAKGPSKVKGFLKVAAIIFFAMALGGVMTRNSLRQKGMLREERRLENVPSDFGRTANHLPFPSNMPGPIASDSQARPALEAALEEFDLEAVANAFELANLSPADQPARASAMRALRQADSVLDDLWSRLEQRDRMGVETSFSFNGQEYKVARVDDEDKIVHYNPKKGEKFAVPVSQMTPAAYFETLRSVAGSSPAPAERMSLAMLATLYELPPDKWQSLLGGRAAPSGIGEVAELMASLPADMAQQSTPRALAMASGGAYPPSGPGAGQGSGDMAPLPGGQGSFPGGHPQHPGMGPGGQGYPQPPFHPGMGPGGQGGPPHPPFHPGMGPGGQGGPPHPPFHPGMNPGGQGGYPSPHGGQPIDGAAGQQGLLLPPPPLPGNGQFAPPLLPGAAETGYPYADQGASPQGALGDGGSQAAGTPNNANSALAAFTQKPAELTFYTKLPQDIASDPNLMQFISDGLDTYNFDAIALAIENSPKRDTGKAQAVAAGLRAAQSLMNVRFQQVKARVDAGNPPVVEVGGESYMLRATLGSQLTFSPANGAPAFSVGFSELSPEAVFELLESANDSPAPGDRIILGLFAALYDLPFNFGPFGGGADGQGPDAMTMLGFIAKQAAETPPQPVQKETVAPPQQDPRGGRPGMLGGGRMRDRIAPGGRGGQHPGGQDHKRPGPGGGGPPPRR